MLRAIPTYCAMETKGRKKRRKRLVRAVGDDLPPFRVSPRDRRIIRAVYEHRALTTDQIQGLLFPTKAGLTHCQHRLKLLFHHGYLFRDEQPTKLSEGRKPLVYFLDAKGAAVLSEMFDLERGELDWHPRHNVVSHPFLNHLLETNEVRVAVEVAAEQQEAVVRQWLDEKTLKGSQMKEYVTFNGPQGGRFRAAIVPDGYFLLETREWSFRFFLEVDRGTVTGQWNRYGRRSWAKKTRAYLAYYRSGKYERRYGSSKGRVLTATVNEKRLATLKTITEGAGGRDRFWFTTFDRVTPETVLTAPIWHKAGDSGLYALTR